MKALGIACVVLGTATVLGGIVLDANPRAPRWVSAVVKAPSAAPAVEPGTRATPTVAPGAAAPRPAAPSPAPTPAARSFSELQAQVEELLRAAGVEGGVSLIELDQGRYWSLGGDQPFEAASTYKLPLLMEEAENVAAGTARADDVLCYDDEDWEDGWFSDYAPGACYTRGELDERVGQYSDNTAAHILVRADGGGDALNAYASAHGATESEFWDPNVTTTSDLARLWQDEAAGRAGGSAAQQYLYPLLTDTAYEDGIPAGVPAGNTVVHKIGILDGELNDAALVLNGPRGAYVLTVCTDDADWAVIADVARAVARFEASA